jgi:hypothetical protein
VNRLAKRPENNVENCDGRDRATLGEEVISMILLFLV